MKDIEELRRKGTTTVGLVCDDSAIFAADTRATAGTLIASKRAQKIFEIEPHIGLTTAGAVGDTQSLVNLLRAEARLFRMRTKGPISVKALANLTANIIHGQRYFPYLVQLMMGGHDSKGPSIYMIDLWGGLSEEKVGATGSGSPVAYGLLENRYNPDLSEEEGIQLAVASLKAALQRDAATGNSIEAVVINKDGYMALERDRLDEVLKTIPEQRY
jgi:proteasome beta subunit